MEILEIISRGYKSTRTVFQCCDDDCSIYDNGKLVIYDKDVADKTVRHMRFLDRLNPKKVARAALVMHEVLSGDLKEPTKNWKFEFK